MLKELHRVLWKVNRKLRNSVKKFRKEKGLSQEGLGKLTNKAFQTISQYENSDEPLPLEFLQNAAKVLGTSVEQLEAEPERSLREEGPAYRTQNIPVALMPDFIVEQLEKYLAGKLPVLSGKDRALAVDAVNCLGYERDRRAIEKQNAKGKL